MLIKRVIFLCLNSAIPSKFSRGGECKLDNPYFPDFLGGGVVDANNCAILKFAPPTQLDSCLKHWYESFSRNKFSISSRIIKRSRAQGISPFWVRTHPLLKCLAILHIPTVVKPAWYSHIFQSSWTLNVKDASSKGVNDYTDTCPT